jgi:hypothetical protein
MLLARLDKFKDNFPKLNQKVQFCDPGHKKSPDFLIKFKTATGIEKFKII